MPFFLFFFVSLHPELHFDMKKRLFFLLMLSLLTCLGISSQTVEMPLLEEKDSDQLVIDSLKRELDDHKLRMMLMKHMLDSTGHTARTDSLRKERLRQHIDSLRQVTPGSPVVIDGDTLFFIYASLGGEDRDHRVSDVCHRILLLGKSLKATTDSVHLFESDMTTDIMVGEIVVMRVSDLDGLWNGQTRQELAEDQKEIIRLKIEELQEQYGLNAKLRNFGMALVIIVLQIVFFILTARFIRWLRKEILSGLRGYMRPVVIKGYELCNVKQGKHILLIMTRVLQVALVIFQLLISLPSLFSIFPETEKFARNMIRFIWNPLEDIFSSLVSFFPNLVKICIIIFIVRWLLRMLNHMASEVESGRLHFDTFYEEWAKPTYQIVRIFVIAFTLIVIWPLLPGSDSGVFKGVSIFVAALFSLGSTASIGNLVSGIIITYMRPFLVGDFVRIGDREGTVIEKNAFITRLRDIKENVITVPNNSILSLPTVNYTAAVRQSGGTIVHSDFTFTYKVFRQQIEPLLLEAASRCELLLKTPPPFVLITELEDFYTRYQINAYTQESQRLPDVYTELHRHILDVFRENNLEPTSSHFVKVNQ